jgi:undecaprenyl diphosphate synthase
VFIGERGEFSAVIQEKMDNAERLTANNRAITTNIAASYGGRWDIVRAARQLAAEAVAGKIAPGQIDEALFASRLSLADQPEPDLFIRTGGDLRISNFLLWQLAYTEMWFTETLWPDLDETTLRQAIEDFGSRERRFGLTSAQVSKEAK